MMQQVICGVQYTACHNIDIIPGKYEGGQTLWECTINLLQFPHKQYQNKVVIDMGCGLGLLGIQALQQGAKKVIFQDFNEETYKLALEPQIKLNFPKEQPCYEFVHGDWDQMTLEQADMIVASEVIYREDNYAKVQKFIVNNLKVDGVCMMINKDYYFGVGGSVQGFKNSLKQLKVLNEYKLDNKKGVKKTILILGGI